MSDTRLRVTACRAAPASSGPPPRRSAAWAEPYKRDLKTLKSHLLDAAHFALETEDDTIAGLMRDFLGKNVK